MYNTKQVNWATPEQAFNAARMVLIREAKKPPVKYLEMTRGIAYVADCGIFGTIENEGTGGGTWFRPSPHFIEVYGRDVRDMFDEFKCDEILDVVENVTR